MANSVTFNPVVMPGQQRADGSYNLKIRLTYKRKSRIISTNVTVPKASVTRSHEIKDKNILLKAYSIIAEFQSTINTMSMRELESMDVDGVLSALKRGKESFRLDFFKYAERVIVTKTQGTQATYRTAVNAFRRFIGRDMFDVSEFTVTLLKDFERFLADEPKHTRCGATSYPKKKGVSAARYIGKLHYIYSSAREEFNDEDAGIINIPRDPFSRIHVDYTPSIAHISKEPQFIQRLISFDGKCTPGERFALDVYILSFALMGMNAADMIEASPSNGDIIVYNRVKTRERRADKAEHRVRIEPCIASLMEKYSDPEGERLFCFHRKYRTPMAFSTSIRCLLRSWARKNGEEPFTLYSARHAWATIARSSRCGIGKDVVNECLCHIDPQMKIADVYIEKDWTVLWEANRKVLSIFDW